MTEYPKASLAFLTQGEPGVGVLNLQFELGDDLTRAELSQEQLCNLVVDGATIAMRTPNRLHGAYINESGEAV